MRLTKMNAAIAAAAAMAMSPSIAMAQDNGATTDAQYDQRAQEDDNDFPWGLLGLLGLAGLLGRKKQERDIHVDARKH